VRDAFTLDPDIVYLNHGSYGACPRMVLDEQSRLRAQLERQPVRFLGRELEPLLDDARRALAAFVGADPAELAFVHNATSGVNAVLRSLTFAPGDEILTTDQAYNACRNALDWVAARAGVRVVVARVPFPPTGDDQVVDAVLAAVTARTRLALIDHVTSPTATIFPVRRLVPALEARGIDVLVDGAHAPGMLPLDLRALDAAYYVGNCHKWMCAPKGAGFLVARKDRHAGLVPAVVSHGLNLVSERPLYHLLFDWVGTIDPTAWLCVPTAIAAVGAMLPGGWPEVMARNRALALDARRLLGERLEIGPSPPEGMLGSMVSFSVGDGDPVALHDALELGHGIEIPVFPWPTPSSRTVRVSLAIYNQLSDVQRLAEVLRRLLGSAG
jgi:isopenicillin-N epimerase